MTRLANARSGLLAACLVFAGAQQALAETYMLPIEGTGILKVFVDGGEARRVSIEDGVTLYEVTMDNGGCRVTEVTVVPARASGVAKGMYDVCSETGFGISYTRVRN